MTTDVVSFAYHDGNVCPEMAVPYSHFMQCVANMHRHARWVEFRIRNSQNLLSAYNHYVRAIDPLADSFHAMDSGTMTRDEVQLLHNQAMDAKKDLKLAYEAYWQDNEELNSLCKGWARGPGYTREHLKVFLHDLIWEEHLSIQAINREVPNINLHNLIVYTAPQAFNMWQDVVQPSERLEASLVKLAKYTEPPAVALQRMVRATKDDVTDIKARLNAMVIAPAPDFVPKLCDIQIIQDDLKKIMDNIDKSLCKGAEWNLNTFGCTRDDLVAWRSQVNHTKADLDHKEVEKRKTSESRVNTNCRGKVADWPKVITQESWATFLQVWNIEKNNFHSDWHKCRHLINAMTTEDKLTFGLFTESDRIIAGLTQIYGNYLSRY